MIDHHLPPGVPGGMDFESHPIVTQAGREAALAQSGATLAPSTATDLTQLIQVAREGMSPDALEKLVGLCERVADRRAAQEFSAALAAFQRDCPPIIRRTENSQFMVTRSGVKRPSMYANLEDIATTVRESLAANGLSYSWGNAVVLGDSITMSCVLAHVGGHRRESSVTLPHESRAGSSPQQKYGSTITYLQRYSLVQVLGLTTCDEDNDGNAEESGPLGTLTEEQARQISDLLIEANADRGKFLKYMGLPEDAKLSQIPACDYERAIAALETKRNRR
jgi:hypothetical protein